MVKLKRTSENQLTKDTYDRGEEDSRFADEPDPGQGMDRASHDVIQKRRIVSATRWVVDIIIIIFIFRYFISC